MFCDTHTEAACCCSSSSNSSEIEASCALQGRDEAKGQSSAAGGPKRPSLRKAAADCKQLATPAIEAGSEPRSKGAFAHARAPAVPSPMAPTQSCTSSYSPTAGQAYSPSDALGAYPLGFVFQCHSGSLHSLPHAGLHGFLVHTMTGNHPVHLSLDVTPCIQTKLAVAIAAEHVEG